jgi:hypothetical protein
LLDAYRFPILAVLQKAVVYAPWSVWPKPIWFHSHENVVQLGKRLAAISADPSLLSVPGLAFQSLFG